MPRFLGCYEGYCAEAFSVNPAWRQLLQTRHYFRPAPRSRACAAVGSGSRGSGPTQMLEYPGEHGEDAIEWINMKTKLTQRRFKAQKSSACGLCKPWKKGGEDKKTVGQLRKAQDADQQLKEVSLRPSSTAK